MILFDPLGGSSLGFTAGSPFHLSVGGGEGGGAPVRERGRAVPGLPPPRSLPGRGGHLSRAGEKPPHKDTEF